MPCSNKNIYPVNNYTTTNKTILKDELLKNTEQEFFIGRNL
jgi:hypothetical protein